MPDKIIENPTYMEHIRHFFDDADLDHMLKRGVDLTTYPALKNEATRVFQATRPPNAFMPPDPGRMWSKERSRSFRNWIENGFPMGRPQPQQPQPDGATRVRKDALGLSEDEIETLGRAFRGIMERDPDDETSYFHLAGLHWYPAPSECLHHEDRYNPWHRVYLRKFEDALRSVPGCADVTMPYWDITADAPDFVFAPPFDSYTLPRDIHANYAAGYVTSRHSAQQIATNVDLFGIPNTIDTALSEFEWHTFTATIESAHDSGHPSIGATMATPDAAAFDPLFWFFHANWDRLWWEWQQIVGATTLWTFRSTITTGDTDFLTTPFNELRPFAATAEQTIDLAATGVGYALPAAGPRSLAIGPVLFGSAPASRRLRVRPGPLVSVRLKGVDRLAIPGTFQAVLEADGAPLARRAFFQSTEPRACTACREKAVIDLDFLVEAAAVHGRDLTADIELLTPDADRIGARFPLRACGDPTLNVRLLLQESS